MERLVPKQIDIEVTSKCNLRCKFCPQWKEGANVGHMSFDLFKSIIDRVNFPCTIVPWLNGEPLLHPRYPEMIRYITDRKLPAYITTNGTIWLDELFEHITENTSVYQIIFSLDGLCDNKSKSIELARPGTDRVKVLGNIDRFLKLKLEKGSAIDVALKICRRGQDFEEIENYIAYWLQRRGVSYVCVGKALIEDQNDEMRVFPCQYSDNNFMVIKSDGRVVLCAYNNRMTNDPELAMARIKDDGTPLLDIYNNAKFTEFREEQRKGHFTGPCATCGFAYTGQGFEGSIWFRDESLFPEPIYYHQDYYNEFFSLTRKWKPRAYYKQGYIREPMELEPVAS